LSTTISLSNDERKTLLGYLRRHQDPRLRLRAHIVLLLADGYTWSVISCVLYCSSRTVARWKGRFADGRVGALLGLPQGAPPSYGACWAALVVRWVTRLTPRAKGFCRSRWSCALVSLLLWREHQVWVGRETARRWLHAAGLVWRRPRPVLKRKDPRREEVLRHLRGLLLSLPDDETVVWQDEVDISLNPKIGCMWMRRGRQAEVATPGDNEKCCLAGSLHWRTGELIRTEGPRRDGALFTRHLEDLRRELKQYRRAHLILDNARFHYQSRVLWEYLHEHKDRFVFHLLPRYAPELNPIERVWWALHEQITRNHQCQSLKELVDLVFAWLEDRKRFEISTSAYQEQATLLQAG
jgi:putative transposase